MFAVCRYIKVDLVIEHSTVTAKCAVNVYQCIKSFESAGWANCNAFERFPQAIIG